MLDVIVHHSDLHPEALQMIDEAPEFALGFLRREIPTYLATTLEALQPVLDAAPVVRDGTLTRSQLAEIFLRIGMSHVLLPSPRSGELPQRVAALWAALAGRPRRS